MRLSGRKSSSIARPWTQRQRLVLLTIIGLNVAVYGAQLILDAYEPGFVREFLGFSEAGLESAYAWQFFAAPFVHAGPWHLAGNMVVLYLLGRDVESILGQRHFLFLYLAGGFLGELGHLALMPASSVLFAASGGVVAVVLAYATILPELEITALVFLVFPVRLKAKYLAYAVTALGVALVFVDRSATVLHSAILGGAAAGFCYAHLLGFGRPSPLQRALHRRRQKNERLRQMDAEQFISAEVDPLLDKIARQGLGSLTRSERRILLQAREKLVAQS